jgi:ribonuclease HI
MNDSSPHYLLMCEASRAEGVGRWRFALRPVDGSTGLEVADVEPDIWGERLDLLTVVRALESLDQPSKVTLIGCTRYVEQGILYGVPDWRENGWRWEYFGQMVPVRDADLWQRMDRLLQFHQVDCGQRRIDAGHTLLAGPHWGTAKNGNNWVDRIARGDWLKCYGLLLATWFGFWMEIASRLWQRAAVGTDQRSGITVQGSGFST